MAACTPSPSETTQKELCLHVRLFSGLSAFSVLLHSSLILICVKPGECPVFLPLVFYHSHQFSI